MFFLSRTIILILYMCANFEKINIFYSKDRLKDLPELLLPYYEEHILFFPEILPSKTHRHLFLHRPKAKLQKCKGFRPITVYYVLYSPISLTATVHRF